jgi:putative SOS response-associated peptidase YedK
MPVILGQQDWPMWLGEVEGDPAMLVRPAGEDVLKVWPVSKQANSPRNYGRSCWRELGDGD